MVKTTKAQRQALHQVWTRTIYDKPNPLTYREFRATVQPGWDCIMVPWAGMWLGIESDGYTHS
jgi:hypothetical protein